MRVLWLTHTPAGASKLLNFKDAGRGWISSLEDRIKQLNDVNLAVAFFSNQKKSKEGKFTNEGVTYYPMKLKYTSFTGKLHQRLFCKLYDSNTEALRQVVNDFRPDVIHLFGTESGVGDIVKITRIPVIVHLQGLVNPYLYSWLPKGISQRRIFFNSPLRAILFRRGTYFEYELFRKRALRETEIIKKARYYFGRTGWDRNFLKLYKKDFEYFRCEEVLRPAFYKKKWLPANSTHHLRIVTTINPQLYKGIEIILATAQILKAAARFSFEWTVAGINETDELVCLIEKITGERFRHYNVSFKGQKSEDELMALLIDSSVFVHPSHIDNSPNSVCEAMLIGMPVIAGYVGGIPSIVSDGLNGLLYNSNDPYDLAGKIIEIAENPSLAAALSYEARKTAAKRHDADTIVSTVYETYKLIVGIESSKVTYTELQ